LDARRKDISEVASGMRASARIAASAASSSAILSSRLTANGSIAHGPDHESSKEATSASRTRCGEPTVDDARAIATACRATRSAASGVTSLVAANPHAPSAITRTPMPNEEAESTPSTTPFRTDRRWVVWSVTRTSAYVAPARVAASRQAAVKDLMVLVFPPMTNARQGRALRVCLCEVVLPRRVF
jgi:hypothetical protein